MKQGNRISATITPADKTSFITSLKELTGRLDFLVTLQPEDSKSLRKIGVDGVPYALAGRDAVRAPLELMRKRYQYRNSKAAAPKPVPGTAA